MQTGYLALPAAEQLSSTVRNLVPSAPVSYSKQVWYQPRAGQPWLWLAESWKSVMEKGYLCQCHSTLLREFLLTSHLTLLSCKLLLLLLLLPSATTKKTLALSPLKLSCSYLQAAIKLHFSLPSAEERKMSFLSLLTDPKASALGPKISW